MNLVRFASGAVKRAYSTRIGPCGTKIASFRITKKHCYGRHTKENTVRKQIRLTVLSVLALALVMIASGCVAGQQVTAADVIAKMRETVKTTQTVQRTADLSVTINKDGMKALAPTIMVSAGAEGTGNKDWTAKVPDS